MKKEVVSKDLVLKSHWADEVAKTIVEKRGMQELITVAAGITPSGVVHIGNFREIITVDLVAKALVYLGKKVRFIYSWDDFDVFRKVPANMPNQEMLTKYLRYAIVDVPDPFGVDESYAMHNEKEVEKYLPLMGVSPEFLYQAKKYRACVYADEIKFAMINRKKIVAILNKYREEPLEENWFPSSIFCEKCHSDETEITAYDENYSVSYSCKCGHIDTFDIRKKGIIKLVWRVDWPMRWNFEDVDFEPSGKEHSSDGGSNTTAELIVKELWGREPPIHIMYEFIAIKGQGGKMSSSKGNTIDLKEMLGVYSPEVIRYLFVSRRPERHFEVSFEGVDVIRAYSEFTKVERIYFGKEVCPEEELNLLKRTYELSCVSVPKELPEQIDFRHLITVAQVYQFDEERIAAYFKSKDKKFVSAMVERVKFWLKNYAEETFKFELQKSASKEVIDSLSENQKKAIRFVSDKLLGKDEPALIELFGLAMKEHNLDQKTFFAGMYKVLINKEFGPRLTTFLSAVGLVNAKNILDTVK